jgi:hypothetical protein
LVAAGVSLRRPQTQFHFTVLRFAKQRKRDYLSFFHLAYDAKNGIPKGKYFKTCLLKRVVDKKNPKV